MHRHRKVLPDLDARCCTRAYPVRLHLEEVYSVCREELLTFEARLQPDESLKSPFLNVGQLATRLDQLLTHKGKLRFGFPAGTLVDDPGSAGCPGLRTQPTCCMYAYEQCATSRCRASCQAECKPR